MEMMMKSTVSKLFAVVLGASTVLFTSSAFADPGHNRGRGREARTGYYPGPASSRIPYATGYYMNERNRRTAYTYPQDYRRYGRPLNWYQGHSNWKNPNHQDWYRGRNH